VHVGLSGGRGKSVKILTRNSRKKGVKGNNQVKKWGLITYESLENGWKGPKERNAGLCGRDKWGVDRGQVLVRKKKNHQTGSCKRRGKLGWEKGRAQP